LLADVDIEWITPLTKMRIVSEVIYLVLAFDKAVSLVGKGSHHQALDSLFRRCRHYRIQRFAAFGVYKKERSASRAFEERKYPTPAALNASQLHRVR